MSQQPLVIRSRVVVLPDGIRPATIMVEDGRIASIGDYDASTSGYTLHDHESLAILPGLVDSHVHVNEPGRTHWEGFDSATRAAAVGGVTTVIDMPLNSVPATTTVAALEEKRAAARGRCWVDVGFWAGAVAGNEGDRAGLHQAGARGFKCFLVPSGVDEFSSLSEAEFASAAGQIAQLSRVLLVHAELPGPVERALAALEPDEDRTCYATYLKTRPDQSELDAIELVIRVCRDTGARLHVVHLATAEALPMLQSARAEGLRVTVETCPHYLIFDAESISDRATEFKCAPPIRSADNREQLWAALTRGSIDLVATDHSPCPPDLKQKDSGDFLSAWGGIASLQLALPATWTEAKRRGHGLDSITRWLSQEPAKLAGLGDRKGAIRVGYDADLTVFDAEQLWRVDGHALEHRHKLTPYHGRELSGVVRATYLRGHNIHAQGRLVGQPTGELL